MPLKKCQTNKKPGYKWGDSGKCYTYDPKSDTSKKNAKKKAIKQGIVVEGPEKFKKEMASASNSEPISDNEYLEVALKLVFSSSEEVEEPSEEMEEPSEEMVMCEKCGEKMEEDAKNKEYVCAKCGDKKKMD